MKKLVGGIILTLTLALALTACKKDKAEDKGKSDDKPTMEEMTPPPGMDMDGERQPDAMKPDAPVASPFKQHKQTYDLVVAAGTKCEKVHFSKACAEEEALKKYTGDLWMNRIKLEDSERLDALTTAIDLLAHADWKVRGFAVQVIMNDRLQLFEKIYKKPESLPKAYIEKMIAAVPTFQDTIDGGWLTQDVAKIVPAYELTDKLLEMAKANTEKNKDLVGYVLKNMVTYSKLKHFDILQSYTKTLTAKDFDVYVEAIGAVSGIRDKLDAAELVKVCAWQKTLIPDALPEELKANPPFGFIYLYYRWSELVWQCKDYTAIPKVKLFEFYDKSKEFPKQIKDGIVKLGLLEKAAKLEEQKAALEKQATEKPDKAAAIARKVDDLKKKIEKLNADFAKPSK